VAALTVIGALVAGGAILQNLIESYPPYITGLARKTYPEMPNVLPPVADLVAMRYKNVINSGKFSEAAKELGLSGEWSEGVYDAARRMLDARDYVTAWRREKISEPELDTALEQLQVSREDIDRFKTTTEFYPSAIDIVRFAVREVYKETQVKKYGMDQDDDDEYYAAAKMAGLPRDIAADFWKAHWDLPSPQQGFEMLHRGEIEMPELIDLLRALDVMPYWREKLTQIAYRPYTRVDVRRMHAREILSDSETLDAYKDLGYDDEKAQRMLEFTQSYNSDETKGVTRSAIVSAYKKGIISAGDLKGYLGELGYNESVVQFWVDTAEYEKAQDEIEERKQNLLMKYRLGAITKQQLAMDLGIGGVSSAYVDEQLRQIDSQDAQKLKMPSRTDVTDWLKLGIIDADRFNTYMLNLGYRREDIINYLTEVALEQDTDQVRYLGVATYVRWLKKGIINTDEFLQIAGAMNLRQDDIEGYLIEAARSEDETQG